MCEIAAGNAGCFVPDIILTKSLNKLPKRKYKEFLEQDFYKNFSNFFKISIISLLEEFVRFCLEGFIKKYLQISGKTLP